MFLEVSKNTDESYKFISEFSPNVTSSPYILIFSILVIIFIYFMHNHFYKKFENTQLPIYFVISDVFAIAFLLLAIYLLGSNFTDGKNDYSFIFLSSPLALTLVSIFTSYTFGVIIPRAISDSSNLFYRSGYISASQFIFGTTVNILSSYIQFDDDGSRNISLLIILVSTLSVGYTEIKRAYLHITLN